MAKFIKKQNMTIVRGSYTNKKGEEKKLYQNIGEIVTMEGDDGGQYQFGEIFFPNIKFKIYDIKPREESATKKATVPTIQQDDQPPSIKTEEEEINIKDIPF